MHTRTSASYGGSNTGLMMCLLPGKITHTNTSSSGDGGKVELWTDGIVDSNDADQLDGGSASVKRTYDVPNGKTVTYKLTPNDGYDMDVLKAGAPDNLLAVAPTRTIYKDDGETIDHYEYEFDGDDYANKEISVTWKRTSALPDEKTDEVQSNPQTLDQISVFAVSICCIMAFAIVARKSILMKQR